MSVLRRSAAPVISVAQVALALLAALVSPSSAQSRPNAGPVPSLPDTLPQFERVVAASDSSALVRAANDALQGKMGVEVPMLTTSFKREANAVLLSLRPQPTPGVVWRNLGGSVRILRDGRRVILSRS